MKEKESIYLGFTHIFLDFLIQKIFLNFITTYRGKHNKIDQIYELN